MNLTERERFTIHAALGWFKNEMQKYPAKAFNPAEILTPSEIEQLQQAVLEAELKQ